MKNGLAAWHYPHRTVAENVRYFAREGYSYVSLHGKSIALGTDGELAEIGRAAAEAGVPVTVHHALPASHSEEDRAAYFAGVDRIARWQREHRVMEILSFDVPEEIRDDILPYVEYAIRSTEGCLVAIEDFGLNEAERAQLEPLRSEKRFGYLIDIGHMLIRLRGESTYPLTLFRHTPDEGPLCDRPGYGEFLTALRSKTFPILEVHLHNNDGIGDLHQFLENGVLDVPMIARALRDAGFDGHLTIESAPGFQFPCYGAEADEKIRRTFEYWKRCAAEV